MDAYPTGRMARLIRAGRAATSIGIASTGSALAKLASGEAVSWREVLLAPENASRVVDALGDLRGAAAKIGQLLSMQTDAILPPAWQEALAQLRDRIEPVGPRVVEGILAEELGADWKRMFGSFDLKPVAAASIAQVHQATLPDGRRLAVKVQYPGMAKAIASDFANLRLALRFTTAGGADRAAIESFLSTAEAQLLEETDFRAEFRALQRYRALIGARSDVVLPEGVPELSTDRLLTMSWCYGLPVEEICLMDQEVRVWFGHLMIDLALYEIFALGCIQSDPNYSNFRVSEHRTHVVMLDFGSVIDIPATSSALLRRLFGAALAGDENELIDMFARLLGLGPAQAGLQEHMLTLCRLVMRPIASPSFDFSDRQYTEDIKKAVMDLVGQAAIRPTLDRPAFAVQRRLSGLFLLCAELGISLNVRDCVAAALKHRPVPRADS